MLVNELFTGFNHKFQKPNSEFRFFWLANFVNNCERIFRIKKNEAKEFGIHEVFNIVNHTAVHCTVSSQDFRSFRFWSFFLSKILQLNFFCEITTYTSRLLSFENFFYNMVLIIVIFMTLIPIFS